MKQFDRILLASGKQWAIGFLIIGLLSGAASGIYFFMFSLNAEYPFLSSITLGFFIFIFMFLIWVIPSIFMLTVHSYTKNKPKTWSPFQSKEIADIGNHLTEEEKIKFSRFGAMNGLIIAVFLSPILFFVPTLLSNKNISFGRIAAMVLFGLFCIPVLLLRRKQGKKLLCSTQWAQKEGYTPDKI